LMFLVHPTLSEDDVKWMAQITKDAVEKATEDI